MLYIHVCKYLHTFIHTYITYIHIYTCICALRYTDLYIQVDVSPSVNYGIQIQEGEEKYLKLDIALLQNTIFLKAGMFLSQVLFYPHFIWTSDASSIVIGAVFTRSLCLFWDFYNDLGNLSSYYNGLI